MGPNASRAPAALAVLALTLAITLLYGSYWLHWHQVPPGDIADNYAYLFQHLAARYRAGELPLWTAFYYAGHPFFGNMHSIFYPGDAVFVGLPLASAFVVDRWLHLLLGGAGSYAAARRLGLSPFGAWVTGLLYACNGNVWEHARAGHVYMLRTSMWFPVLLWAWLAAWDAPRAGRAWGGAAVVAGLFVLSGHPQIFAFGAVAWGLLALTLATDGRRPAPAQMVRRLGWSVGIGLTGLLIAAPQLAPLLELTAQTGRSGGSPIVAGGVSWPPLGWLHTLWPQVTLLDASGSPAVMPHREHGAYLGALPLCCAALGLASPGWRGRRLAVVALVFGVVYALGVHTPVLAGAIAVLPPLGQLRIPARMLFVAAFGVALLAGRGVEIASKVVAAPRFARAVVCAAGLALAAGGLAVMLPAMRTARAYVSPAGGDLSHVTQLTTPLTPAVSLPLLSVVGAVALLVVVLPRVSPRVATPVTGAGVLLNLALGLVLLNRPTFAPLTWPSDLTVRAQSEPSLARVFRRHARRGAMIGLVSGQAHVDGTGPFMSARLEAYLGRVAGARPVRDAGYQFAPAVATCEAVGRYGLLDVAVAECTTPAGREVRELPHRHAWFASTVRTVRDEPMALAAVTAPDFDPAREVVLLASEAAGVTAGGEPAAVSIELLEGQHHRQTWRVRTSQPGVFVVSELAYPGWRVYVDGARRPSLQANFLLRGVHVSAGAWTVEWRYRPWTYAAGGVLSLVGLLVCVVAAVRDRPRAPGAAHRTNPSAR